MVKVHVALMVKNDSDIDDVPNDDDDDLIRIWWW